MIDTKYLMIGSLFSYENCIYEAKVIRDSFVYGINKNGFSSGEFQIEKIKPIILSEEILLKCGFEQVDIFAEYRKRSITLGLVIGDKNQYQLIINGFCTSVILNYLHELQNVYKIFEKQELEIKL